MNASSSKYLNHIGHWESDGCFRCHSGKHESDKGEVISNDCNLCHTIIAEGTTDNLKTTSYTNSLEFVHPIDIGTCVEGKQMHRMPSVICIRSFNMLSMTLSCELPFNLSLN